MSSNIYEFQTGDYLLSIVADSFEEAEQKVSEEFPGPLQPIRLIDLLERIDKVANSPLQLTENDGMAVQLSPGHWTLISDPENEPEDEALLIRALMHDARNRGVVIGTAEHEGKKMISFTLNNRTTMRSSYNELTAYCFVWLQTFEPKETRTS